MQYIVLNGADIATLPAEWLWPRRIPNGALTILDGDPGVGKSLITARLAAAITTGNSQSPYPLNLTVPRDVVFVSSEDDLKRQLLPRLQAAGADLRRLTFFQGAELDDGQFRLPEFPTDAAQLGEIVNRQKPALVIIDPITAYLSERINTNTDSQLRKAVMPILPIAEANNTAFLLVRHLNKTGGLKALYRGAGTIGLVGIARSVLLAAPNPEDKTELVLAQVKSNFGPLEPSVTCRITVETACPVLNFLGASDLSADQLLLSRQPKLPVEAATEFLEETLKRHAVLLKQIKHRASISGIAVRNLRRAKDLLGVRSRFSATNDDCYWYLPSQSADPGMTPEEEAAFWSKESP
jgi:hypothetical protein